jgi:hypothetical protein
MPDKTRKIKYGSRRQVYNGTAEKTAGGLTKEQLIKNERGRIVSVKRHKTMKQRHGGGEKEEEEPKPMASFLQSLGLETHFQKTD